MQINLSQDCYLESVGNCVYKEGAPIIYLIMNGRYYKLTEVPKEIYENEKELAQRMLLEYIDRTRI